MLQLESLEPCTVQSLVLHSVTLSMNQVTEIKRFYWLVPHSVVNNLCVLYQKHDMYKLQLGFITISLALLTSFMYSQGAKNSTKANLSPFIT